MTQDEHHNVNLLEEINRLCRDFRKQFSQGKLPQLESFLSEVGPDGRENLFLNLLEIEINYRRSKKQNPTSSEYLKRFPDFERQVRRAFFEPTIGLIDSPKSEELATRSHGDAAGQLDDSPTFSIPESNRLGLYELVSVLGRGGMGVVYEARNLESGNRVALKTLPIERDGRENNAEKLYRFRREFRQLSEINHPNLVGMQTLEVEGSQWFFTMDLIEGEDFGMPPFLIHLL